VLLGTGSAPASEPESQALAALVARLRPDSVVALHGPLGCIDDPARSDLGQWLAHATAMPLVDGVGYPTPGSFGTWGRENGVHVVTYEFPPASLEAIFHHHVEVICQILDGSWRGI
jgi:protein MpaA